MQLTGKGSLVASSLTAIGASVCCVGPLVLLALGVGGTWVGALTMMEPLRPPLHRVDSTVPGIGIPQALPGATGLYARYTLRRSAHARATATRGVVSENGK
ncbi:mercuric transporter MerT family protein [Pseudomonas aeruginosa]|nr:mercuric transporter MerT family protein [Pseudomonas aeruginosa]